MSDLRFMILAAVLGTVTFVGVHWWINSGERLPVFHRVATGERPTPEPRVAQDDGNPARNTLRQSVIDAAGDFAKDPCDGGNKYRYVEAVTAYANAWLALAPCVAYSTCNGDSGRELDRAQKAFGTPLDHKVRDAMTKAHWTGEIQSSDFPVRTLSILGSLANDPSLMADSQARSLPHVEVIRSRFSHPSRCH